MPRVMEKATPVKIVADELNCYSTQERSCMSGITSCIRVLKKAKAEGDKQKIKQIKARVNEYRILKQKAAEDYDECVDRAIQELVL